MRAPSLSAVIALVALLAARSANAAGPACDAGSCADSDGDGFIACTCAGPSVPCDCDDADPSAYPGAPEACDADKDRNCNGATKEACPQGKGCLASVCVQRCIPLDDFGCPPTSGMRRLPDDTCLCAPLDCTLFGCAPGFTCDDDKTCVPNCHPGVKCPFGQRCRGTGCVDPCAGVTCAEGAACVDGICKPACDCAGATCPPGETCDANRSPPRCIDPACAAVTCASGTHCERGSCVDDCAGVVCPPKRICQHGQCVDLCNPSPCPTAYRCDWRTGACSAPDVGDGGLFIPGDGDVDPLDVVGGGLACTTTYPSASSVVGLVSLALVGIAVGARRRRLSRTR